MDIIRILLLIGLAIASIFGVVYAWTFSQKAKVLAGMVLEDCKDKKHMKEVASEVGSYEKISTTLSMVIFVFVIFSILAIFFG